MRRDVIELRRFYAGPLGRAARDMLGRKLAETWGGCDRAGSARPGLRHPVPGALPAALGARWRPCPPSRAWRPGPPPAPATGPAWRGEGHLPFPNALFDRVLVVHGLEESDDPLALLREVWRVMAPSGRVVLAAAARSGVWCHAEATPFGYGRPFTRAQLEQLAREAELEPIAWSRAPVRPAHRRIGPLCRGFRTGRRAPVAAVRRIDPAGGGETDIRG